MRVSLEGPPGDPVGDSIQAGTSTPEPHGSRMGPLLYAGRKNGDSALVVPVGELVDGRLTPLPSGDPEERWARQIATERFRSGRRLLLFQAGIRIGTFTVSSATGLNRSYCPPRPEATGIIQVVPSASEVTRFLAVDESASTNQPFRFLHELAPDPNQGNAAQNLAGEALNELRAEWPPALLNIRRDLQVFRASEGQDLSLAATFGYGDQLQVGPSGADAYGLFILGEPFGSGYRRAFTWYRRTGEEGKGIPGLFAWMDWNSDGRNELLLQVFGSRNRWFAALARGEERWTVTFQDPCGAHQAPADPG